MKRFSWFVGMVAILIFGVAATTLAVAVPLEETLENLLKDNFAKCEAEDMKGSLATIHGEAPAYDASEGALKEIFEKYDLKYSLESFKLIGVDGDYAVARVLQKTEKKNGVAYSSNVIDSIYVFRMEKGVWKLWQQVMLETRIVE